MPWLHQKLNNSGQYLSFGVPTPQSSGSSPIGYSQSLGSNSTTAAAVMSMLSQTFGAIWSMISNSVQIREMNEYNSPLRQVQRLQDAGLNPYLMYSNGANPGLQTQYAENSNPIPASATADLVNAMSTDQQKGLIDSQISVNQAQALKTLSENKRIRSLLPKELEKASLENVYQGLMNQQESARSIYFARNALFESRSMFYSMENLADQHHLNLFDLEHMKPEQLLNLSWDTQKKYTEQLLNSSLSDKAKSEINEINARAKSLFGDDGYYHYQNLISKEQWNMAYQLCSRYSELLDIEVNAGRLENQLKQKIVNNFTLSLIFGGLASGGSAAGGIGMLLKSFMPK